MAAIAAFAARRNIAKFSDNPDPLGGQLPKFPTGIARSVTTGDGAVLTTVTASPTNATSSAPMVVLVHGLTSNVDDWGPIAHRLIAQGVRVLGIDQRGHGSSTTGSDGYGAARLGADLAEIFETLDLRDVVLAGHSMGGMAALSFLVDHSTIANDRVKSLALFATAATMSDLRYQAGLRLGSLPVSIDLAEAATSDSNALAQLGAAATFGHEPSSFMLDAALASFARCPEPVRLAATRALADHDVTPGLSRITVPTLIAAGTRDLLTPFAESELIANAIPGARLLRMPGVGHQIIWEQNEELAKLLVEMAEA